MELGKIEIDATYLKSSPRIILMGVDNRYKDQAWRSVDHLKHIK